jgi:predicted TIM-barrel fold metal-dependent hydrolase
MKLINNEWVIVAEGDIDTCQDYEPEYQLIRKCENSKEWDILIVGYIDTCQDYQQDDEAEYKIIPVV